VINQASGVGFTQIAAGVGPLSRVRATSSGSTGAVVFETALSGSLAERARIDSSGRVLVGTSTARSNFYNALTSPPIQVEGTTTASSTISLVSNRATSEVFDQPTLVLGRSGGASLGSNTLVASGTCLGSISFQGNDATEFVQAVSIDAFVDGTPSGNTMPGRLVFSTTPSGSATPTERMRINSFGAEVRTNADGNGLKVSGLGTPVGTNGPGITFANINNVGVLTNIASIKGLMTGGAVGVESGALLFYTALGGAAPTERFRVDGDGRSQFFSAGGNHVVRVSSDQAAGTTIILIRGLYSGTDNATTGVDCFRVFTNGNVVNTNNSYGSISDLKLKENIVDANSQWDDLKALQVRNYNLKEGQTHTQIGLVAQEVELVSPGLVSESPDRDEEGNDLGTVTKSVNYSVLYMKAVKALQEAMERIETLEARLTAAGIA